VMVVSRTEIDDEDPRNHHRLGCMMVVLVQDRNRGYKPKFGQLWARLSAKFKKSMGGGQERAKVRLKRASAECRGKV